jgi:hypothetical protein
MLPATTSPRPVMTVCSCQSDGAYKHRLDTLPQQSKCGKVCTARLLGLMCFPPFSALSVCASRYLMTDGKPRRVDGWGKRPEDYATEKTYETIRSMLGKKIPEKGIPQALQMPDTRGNS